MKTKPGNGASNNKILYNSIKHGIFQLDGGVVFMLFRRNIEPSCSYCRFGIGIGNGEVACKKRGIMSVEGRCSAFRYEPTKRTPEYARSLSISEFSEEDFAL